MTGIYLTAAADWLRAAGLVVVEYEGWQYRAKSSGGYLSGRPWGVMWHHTATNADAASEAYYQCYVADAAPISNATIDRDGSVWLLAAGPTNTNGSGQAHSFSRGTVPDDSMNSYAWSIELCNNGRGEPYPQAQIDAAFAVSNAINAHCSNQPSDVCTHTDWAPDRKVDPAQASAVEGPWQPRSINGSGSWNLQDLIAECRARAGVAGPTPEPEDEMLLYVEVEDAWARFVATGQPEPLALWQVGYVTDEGGNPRASVYAQTLRHVTVRKAQLTGCTLVGKPPPADDGGSGLTDWDVERDFYEHTPSNPG